MIYFLLAVAFTVALYVLMRLFPERGINSFHAIVFNYYSCVAVGIVLTPAFQEQFGSTQWASQGTVFTLLQGAIFVLVFLLIGKTSQRSGIMATSIAGNMSLIIPVCFGLFVFQNTVKPFTVINYLGIVMAVVALIIGTWRVGVNKQEERKNFMWPVLYFLVSGGSNVLINYLTSVYYEPGQNTLFMIIACIGAVIIGTGVLLYLLLLGGERLKGKSVVAGLVLGIPNFLSLYFLLKALNAFGNSAAYVFPVYNILTMVASAMVGALFFKERLSRWNWYGMVLAVLAIVALSYP